MNQSVCMCTMFTLFWKCLIKLICLKNYIKPLKTIDSSDYDKNESCVTRYFVKPSYKSLGKTAKQKPFIPVLHSCLSLLLLSIWKPIGFIHNAKRTTLT